MWLIILLVTLIVFCYFKVVKVYKHWKDKGVPYIKPWPIFGNFASNIFGMRSLPDLNEDFYNVYRDKRYVGVYQFVQPTLILRDPELIKKITVKEFDVFPNHNVLAVADESDISSKALFNLSNMDGWHELRATLSPTFTSSKMRSMYVLMEQCADRFTTYFEKNETTSTVNLKDVFTRYTNDVIGTAAFGVTCDSLANPDNEFYIMGKKLTDFSGLRFLTFLGFFLFPKIMKLFNITFFGKEGTTFFQNLIKETLKIRKEQHIVRPDMINLLMEAQENRLGHEKQNDIMDTGFAVVEESEIGKSEKHKKAKISDDDITAQALGFFFAGFETSSNLLCFIAYELAINPDIQKRLREEIFSATRESDGKVTYEILLGMKYLDNVVTETLRKWPPAIFTDRKSVKPFTIKSERPGENTVNLDAGTMCIIPIYSIHRDPLYYPNPQKFDPERFNEENKHNIKPFTYLPFGTGPRNCIGSRFALLESKLLTVKILQKFEIVTVDKTPIPIKYNTRDINLLPKGGIWVGLKPRGITT